MIYSIVILLTFPRPFCLVLEKACGAQRIPACVKRLKKKKKTEKKDKVFPIQCKFRCMEPNVLGCLSVSGLHLDFITLCNLHNSCVVFFIFCLPFEFHITRLISYHHCIEFFFTNNVISSFSLPPHQIFNNRKYAFITLILLLALVSLQLMIHLACVEV